MFLNIQSMTPNPKEILGFSGFFGLVTVCMYY